VSAPRHVIVTPPNFDAAALAFLLANNCRVTFPCDDFGKAEGAFGETELVALLSDADAWIIGPQANVTRSLVEASPRCRAFVRRGVGYERLDVGAIASAGRVAMIAAGGNEDSVADQVIGMMLAVARRMREQHLAMLAGDWSIKVSGELFRKTVGIVGLGRTGRALVRRLRGFETRILVATPRQDENFARDNGIEFVDLATLLRESDFVSLHSPLNAATRHVMNAKSLAAMKPGAILVNAGRGGLVDDAALLAALRTGTLGGAGLDCFEAESDPAMRGVAMELLALPNVVGTPHSAASTREGLARTNMIAARCVVAVLNGVAPPDGCVVSVGR
jgi:D-3-phosphoglycerate dehydrogenase